MNYTNRIQGEIKKMTTAPPAGARFEQSPTDIRDWNILITGPEGTPYAGGHFHLKLKLPDNYPHGAPVASFTHKVYHPNVVQDGSLVCSEKLEASKWIPTSNLHNFVVNVIDLFRTPEPDHALEEQIAQEYINEKKKYEENARKWTRDFAK
ncbi:putative Ubiquitin-conjugating enzyme E2-16 kDa [Blattamonas nauphoetae]|uniref:Ubiquitin-conjugating enzyme E2-16 kDa n=1 Tax=Blattamonas nauphoetae TaxID=2049346 RepID=A0ABQ9YLH7_9EUKA|nr:putative Ubiquitin-conjugating enzyme E2-16 kDa [Blattamonas nauphoetae]